ncbi:MAG: M23 family metallopeptidase [Clostridia bacterium]|nr:M23 family metallopeptidase [Clostridia bacterium]
MNEQNEKATEKEKKGKRQRRKMNGERRFYLFTALGCALALVAIIVVAVAVSGGGELEQQVQNGGSSTQSPLPGSSSEGNNDDNDNEQVVVTPEGMIAPLETVTVINDHGFYHNTTLNAYYEHTGVDFAAEAGTSVLAVDKGVVESIYKSDLLTGTEIVIDHGDGVKTLYRFVTEADGLKVGDKVEKGEVIATVAEANGNEYKDGAHLHFEVLKNEVSVDPAVYLTLEEK